MMTERSVMEEYTPVHLTRRVGTFFVPAVVAAMLIHLVQAQDQRVPELRTYPRPLKAILTQQTTRTIYETIGKMTGIQMAWDDEAKSKSETSRFTVEFSGATLREALDKVASVTHTSWRPTSETSVLVTLR